MLLSEIRVTSIQADRDKDRCRANGLHCLIERQEQCKIEVCEDVNEDDIDKYIHVQNKINNIEEEKGKQAMFFRGQVDRARRKTFSVFNNLKRILRK